MASLSSPSLTFTVRRCKPELVVPAMPTPKEIKLLSDIDDQEGLRFIIPVIQIYPNEPSMLGKDPVKIIRQALAQTLVFYYPFAGRLREGPDRKLMVDCTGEGVLFVEADADITLDQFGGTPQPPFSPLLYDVPGSYGVIDSPLVIIQVTRLKCGGFILAICASHNMCDGIGMAQLINAMVEMARGAREPSIRPVWCRELLSARDTPRITCIHREYEEVSHSEEENIISKEDYDIVEQSFFFGPVEIAALRRFIPLHLQKCTKFEVITACLWCCLTKAWELNPHEEVRMMCLVNARARLNPPLPVGYYGNVIAYPAAVTTVEKLNKNSFGFVVELIQKVKAEVTNEYMHSVADLMVTKGRPLFTTARSFFVSNLTHFGFREMDFGWGKPVYGGIAKGGAGNFPWVTYFNSYKNEKGQEGALLPICLPNKVMMSRFVKELSNMLGNQHQPPMNGPYPRFVPSAL
ncbi:hypothetical protein RIF29_24318 [Crotalaria pallida]|uniref:Benzyl alcohol O-benzoyltransferase n=1 Tax=Crotalaria pallida TaxID=3830 RepID=A0AAN9EPP3_CROPI